MIGIGIDTGGTCTDISVYEHESGKVLAAAKSQTTREDLKIGILESLSKIAPELRSQASYVTLSTTLATNACVEGKGGRAGLILIGAHPTVVQRYGGEYGLPPLHELMLLNLRPGDTLTDAKALEPELREKFSACDNIAIVQISPEKDGAALEQQMARIVTEILGIPVTLGSSLFSELNVLSRAASTLLNAKLVPIMAQFLAAVEAAMAQMGLKVPIWIVRSDGTLMSREFAAEHPVGTLLCGPAASVIGARRLSQAQDALIVDMGGTTTDISVVRDGYPMTAPDGIQIGSWHTMVHGVYIHTIGLGGDSRMTLGDGGALALDNRRCIPLCVLASRYPQVRDHLSALAAQTDLRGPAQHEFLVLIRAPKNEQEYSSREIRLCSALQNGPLPLQKAALIAEESFYSPFSERLEQEGIVLRAGLTPTDIMHIRGSYTAYDREASAMAVQYLSRRTGVSPEEFCDRADTEIIRKLYCLLVKVMLQSSDGFPANLKEPTVLDAIAAYAYSCAGQSASLAALRPECSSALVGIGAPTHFYLPAAANLLGMECIIPEYASTANAFGAAVSRISVNCKLEIWPREGRFVLCGGPEEQTFATREEALAAGQKLICQLAENEARKRGALGDLDIETEERVICVPTKFGEVYVRTDLTARAAAAFV